ncbi:glycine-N-acyltransferase-like protein 3 [Syngnathus acus]|uniref:glycine-N-acyltransferase-like protein 3 n=1 Tax=Syngnathus acus TaxID=161584 RepID=UPI00188608DF|nr:glycine-N-acyltransferase-like protein 3 [Syngnathus acus]
MIILKAFKDLTLMKKILYEELPQSIRVLGGLHHILRNNVFQLKICVDSWPTFSTAICYHQKQNMQIGSSFVELPYNFSIFSKNQDTLRSLLSDDKLVKWKNKIEFGVSNHHSEIVREIASLRGLHVEDNGGYHSYINYSPEKLDMPDRKTSTLATSTLNESHAELVVQQLPYGGSNKINIVKAYIKHLPNCCVVDEKGHPVSWLLTDEFHCLRMAYTQPKYRRKSHFQDMTLTLVRQRISEGFPVYCYLHKDNVASIGLANKAGFTRGEESTFMYMSTSEK